MAQQIGTIGGDVDFEAMIAAADHLSERSPRQRLGLESEQAVVLGAQAEFAGGAEHSLGGLAAELAPFDHHAAGHRGAEPGERILAAGHHVWRAADHVPEGTRAVIDGGDPELVGVGVGPHIGHHRHDELLEIGAQRLHCVDRGAQHSQTLGDIGWIERLAEECLKPATGGLHAPSPANWPRKRMSPPYSSRMSGTP